MNHESHNTNDPCSARDHSLELAGVAPQPPRRHSVRIFDPGILCLPLFEDRHRTLAAKLEAWVAEHEHLPRSQASLSPPERGRVYTRLLGSTGWLSYAIDPAPGRERPDLRSVCLIREAFAYLDDLLDFAFAIQGLAVAAIGWFGCDRQRAELLPQLRTGEIIGSLALSEPECSSNLATLTMRARKSPQGYELSGVKTWVSNGNIADWHTVLARTGEGPGGLGLSFLLAPASGAMATDIPLLAPRAFASLTFNDCAVPSDALIGEAGWGLPYALEILDFYRVTVGAAAIGFCRRGFEAAVQWCRNRTVASSRLIETQLTSDKLAGMAVYLDSASLLVARAAWEFDTGVKDVNAHASMAKLYATDGAAGLVDATIQLFGAAGLVAESVPEQLYRQIRSLRIYEGTSEIQKLVIAGAVSRPR